MWESDATVALTRIGICTRTRTRIRTRDELPDFLHLERCVLSIW